MKVVFVNDSLPYPPTAGNRIRTLNLMLRMARRHSVSYICRGGSDAGEMAQAREFLADHSIEPIFVDDIAAPKAGLAFYGRLAANLLSPLPYAISGHNSRAVKRAARDYALQHHVDLWQYEWLSYGDALRGLAVRAPQIITAHNVESLIWQRYWSVERDPVRRWYLQRQWRKFDRYEQRMFAQAAHVIAVSEADARIVREHYRVDHVSVVDNGIDRAYFAAAAGQRDPRQILFLGSLDWRPNVDAARLLLDRIFPQVLRDEPSARLCVVGRRPPEMLLHRIRALPNAELHADVADVRPYLAQSALMVVPLRIGGGSRLKILEALGCGLPVVSTSVGCEGLRLLDGGEITISDPVEEMAGAIVHCLRHPAEAQAQAQRGRQVVYEQYDWDVLADRMELIWDQALRRAGTLEEVHS